MSNRYNRRSNFENQRKQTFTLTAIAFCIVAVFVGCPLCTLLYFGDRILTGMGW